MNTSTDPGARVVRGEIHRRWAELGWERSPLGYPLTDELGTPDERGRFNHFEGGSVYWSPASGGHVVYPQIRDLSLIHISEPTRRTPISYAVFCLKKKKK